MILLHLDEITDLFINRTIRTNAKYIFITRLVSYSPAKNEAEIQHKNTTFKVDTSLLGDIEQIDEMYMFIGDIQKVLGFLFRRWMDCS